MVKLLIFFIQAERAKQKRQVPLSLQLVDGAPRSFDPMKMKIIGTSTGNDLYSLETP